MQPLYCITRGFPSLSGLLPRQQHPGERREIKPRIQPRGCCLSNSGGGCRDPGSAARGELQTQLPEGSGHPLGKKVGARKE